MRFSVTMPVEMAGMFPPQPCGRWGYRCSRLFCQRRCVRTDVHISGEHRCPEHEPAAETWPVNSCSVS